MLIKYFYNPKIAHASYLVGCQATQEAIVIDPGRDITPYLQAAKENNVRIVAATETHIHADFVSGVRELAERVEAKLYLSDEGDEAWKYQYLTHYEHQLLHDGDTFKIGNILFEVLHTPGHTPEHICFTITDTVAAHKPIGLFSGDFIFVGGVGRPDLLEEVVGISGSAEVGARQMFHSLKRFKELPDYLQVWSAHGAGSACGKSIGAIPSTTVGYEKLFSPLLQIEDEAAFVQDLLSGQPEAPFYFAKMKEFNKIGPAILDELPGPKLGSFDQLVNLLALGATIVDTRSASEFRQGHIPGTINIPVAGDFTNWSGWLLSYNRPFYVITAKEKLSAIMRELASIGLDNLEIYFDPWVVETWASYKKPLQSYQLIGADKLAEFIQQDKVTVLDVRRQDEWQAGHLPQAKHLMLGYLPHRLAEIPTDKPIVVQCQAGARSAVGASILQAHGFKDVLNLSGGYNAWQEAGLPVEIP